MIIVFASTPILEIIRDILCALIIGWAIIIMAIALRNIIYSWRALREMKRLEKELWEAFNELYEAAEAYERFLDELHSSG